MRLLFLIVLFATNTLLDAQEETLISFDFRNTELVDALMDIENNYSISFSYGDDLVHNKKVTSRADDLTLDEALQKLFSGRDIGFKIIDRKYVLLVLEKDSEILSEHILGESLNSRTYKIQGRVLDAESGTGLPFAQIYVASTNSGCHTDTDGYFDCDLMGSTTDSVRISSLGYTDQKLYLPNSESKSLSIDLAISSIGLADVVVTEYLTDGIQGGNELGQIRFSPPRIDLLPGQAEPDVLQAILLLPGVSSPTESVSDINIRGGTADQNLVLWDGIPIYHTGHYFGSFTAFNSFIVDKVDVWRGGFGAQFGGRVAGVIDIQSQNDIHKAFRAGLGMNLTHGHAFAEVPLVENKLSFMFSARRSFTDILRTITFNTFQGKIFQGTKVDENERVVDEEISIDTDRFYFADAHAKIIWKPNEKDKFSAVYFVGNNDLEFALAEPEARLADVIGIENWGAKLDWQRSWSPNWSSGLYASYSYFDYNAGFVETIDGNLDIVNLQNLNALSDQRISFDTEWKAKRNTRLKFGASWVDYNLSFNINYQSIFDDDFNETSRDSTDVYSVFLEYQLEDTENRWALQLGFRHVSVPNLEEFFWEPRANVSYRTETGFRFKANAGVNHQFINQLIEFGFTGLGVGNQIWTLVDGDDFPALRSTQLAIGADWGKNGWFFDVEAYHRQLVGITSLASTFASFDEVGFNEGRGRSYGLDALIRKRWGDHQSWLSYSLSRSEYFFEELEDDWFPAINDQRHRFSWVYLWQQKRFSLSLGWTLETGRPFTPLADVLLEELEDEIGPFTLSVPILGEVNARNLPASHRLDVSALYKFPSRRSLPANRRNRGANYQIGLSVINIYNQRNLRYRSYRDIIFEDGEEPIAQVETFERDLLPFTPNLFFRVAW
ncbi:MAG: TonB-dependent receptor [Bacteroidota bacterium]